MSHIFHWDQRALIHYNFFALKHRQQIIQTKQRLAHQVLLRNLEMEQRSQMQTKPDRSCL